MKKFLMTCAAIIGVSMAFAATSFAATYDLTAGTVSLDATKLADLADQQLTVIVVEAEDGELPAEIGEADILYINQEAKGTTDFQGMKLLAGSLVENKQYIIAVGGEDIADGIITELVDTTPVVEPEEPEDPEPPVVTNKKGDIDGTGAIETNDVLAALSHFKGVTPLSDTAVIDVDGDGSVTISDILAILSHYKGVTPLWN